MTPDLPAFLFARAADREREAPDVHTAGCSSSWWEHDRLGYGPDECDCGEPARVLADCAALRAVVDLHQPTEDTHVATGPGCTVCRSRWPCRTLRALAQPDADHPEFDPSWRAGG